MKRILLAVPALLVTLLLSAQNYSINWGEEMKLKKGTADLDIVAADNTGLYFTEARIRMKSYFLIGATYGSAHKLFKVDKNFAEVFEKDYKKELRSLDFHSFQTLGNDLYMFATDYEKKEKLFKAYAARIDKNSGDLMGDFKELGSYKLESKKDDYEMKITLQKNGELLMVSNISGKDHTTIGVILMDKNFSQKESAIINLSFVPGTYTLQDVKLAQGNKLVLMGKVFEEAQVKRKKKRLVFKEYVLSIYGMDGKRETAVSTPVYERFIINGRLIEQPNGELLLAGFYSNSAQKKELNGFFINKLNVQTGELVLSSFKEINTSMLGKNFVEEDDDDDESKEEKKELEKRKSKKSEDDEEDELPNEFIIRTVNINPADNSIIITSEVSQYTRYEYATSTYNSATKSYSTTWHTVHRFTNKDILVINADKDGNIRWINDIPKNQREEVRSSNSGATYLYMSADDGDYFAGAGALPYYSSHISLLHNNNLVIIMNDHTTNNVNASYGDKIKTVYNFRKKSNAYGISIDLATGKMTRKFIATNNDETILMPRHAFVVKNELFLPSWRQRMMAKTKLKFSKIVVK